MIVREDPNTEDLNAEILNTGIQNTEDLNTEITLSAEIGEKVPAQELAEKGMNLYNVWL